MNFYHGYWKDHASNVDGKIYWREVIVNFREGNSERLSALSMLRSTNDAEIYTVFSLDMFTDSQAEMELAEAVMMYNKEMKRYNEKLRLADENEMKDVLKNHKDKNVLLILLREKIE